MKCGDQTTRKSLGKSGQSIIKRLLSLTLAMMLLISFSPLIREVAWGEDPGDGIMESAAVIGGAEIDEAAAVEPAEAAEAESAEAAIEAEPTAIESESEAAAPEDPAAPAAAPAPDPSPNQQADPPGGIAPASIITNSSGLLAQLSLLNQGDSITIGIESWVVVKIYGSGDNKAIMLARKGGTSIGKFGPNNNYAGSTLQNWFTNYYTSWTSPLKDLALVPTLGTFSDLQAVSNPQVPFVLATNTSQTVDIVFAMSRKDMVDWNNGKEYPVQSYIRNNWPMATESSHMWLRTKGTGTTTVWELNNTSPGTGYIADAANSGGGINCNMVPTLWVKVAGVWRTVTVHCVDTNGNPLVPPVSPTTYQVLYDEGITLEPSDIPAVGGYQFTDLWRLGSPVAANKALPAAISHVTTDTDIYLVYDVLPLVDVNVHYIDRATGLSIKGTDVYTITKGGSFTLASFPVIKGYIFADAWQKTSTSTPELTPPVAVTGIMSATDIYILYDVDESGPLAQKDAYIDDSPIPENGSLGSPEPVEPESQIRYTITVDNYLDPDAELAGLSPIGNIVFDEVPDGLEVDPISISHNGYYDPVTRTIAWDLSSEPAGEVTVEFTVTVEQPLTFVNTAFVIYYDNSMGQTNSTYHMVVTEVGVTEYFREIENESNVLDDSIDGNHIDLDYGDPYIPEPGIPPAEITKAGVTYAYYGYRIDDGSIDLTPHGMLPSELIGNVTKETDITYLYAKKPAKDAYINGSAQAQNGTASVYQAVKPGDTVTYVITINQYQAGAYMLIDYLPDGLVFVSSTNGGAGSFTNLGQSCTWIWANLPAGQTVVTVTALVDPTDETDFVNVATLYAGGFVVNTNQTYHRLKTDTTFSFTKVDENDQPMDLVAFALYACTDDDPATHAHDLLVSEGGGSCWGDAISAISDSNGLVEFEDLKPGSYMLVEVGTHAGYQLPLGQWLIEVTDTLDINITSHGYSPTNMPPAFKSGPDGGELLLPNYRQMEVPLTSGPGLVGRTVAGIMLAGGGVAYAIMPAGRRRRPVRSAKSTA